MYNFSLEMKVRLVVVFVAFLVCCALRAQRHAPRSLSCDWLSCARTLFLIGSLLLHCLQFPRFIKTHVYQARYELFRGYSQSHSSLSIVPAYS